VSPESGSGGIAFDPVASDYDRTRALPPRAQASVVDLLSRELRGRGTLLEIGVGTGRMALPLAAAGLPLAGVDLSLPMIERLRHNAGGRAPFPVAAADATRLPFRAATFGGAYAVHVLHLIPGWRTAVAELVRVVRPGGVVLMDIGGGSSRIGREIRAQLEARLGGVMNNAGLEWGRERLDGVMADLGATRRAIPPVSDVDGATLDSFFRMIADGRYSWTWSIPEAELRRAVDAIRLWAEERFGDLTAPLRERRRIRFRAYDLRA
jgi:SAM-dependent methyltransferase